MFILVYYSITYPAAAGHFFRFVRFSLSLFTLVQSSTYRTEPGNGLHELPGIHFCKFSSNVYKVLQISINFRHYDDIYDKLRTAGLQGISKLTGCLKPCHYKKYSYLGEKEPSLFKSGNLVSFSLWAVSDNTRVSREKLIYPLSSLIAEFGGTLGLFLGFSFLTLWDNFHSISVVSRVAKVMQSCKAALVHACQWG